MRLRPLGDQRLIAHLSDRAFAFLPWCRGGLAGQLQQAAASSQQQQVGQGRFSAQALQASQLQQVRGHALAGRMHGLNAAARSLGAPCVPLLLGSRLGSASGRDACAGTRNACLSLQHSNNMLLYRVRVGAMHTKQR